MPPTAPALSTPADRTCCRPIPIPGPAQEMAGRGIPNDGPAAFERYPSHVLDCWTLGELENYSRMALVSPRQRAAYLASWCATGHDPRTCTDLWGRTRTLVGHAFHYMKPDGEVGTVWSRDDEEPAALLARTYGEEAAARYRAADPFASRGA